MNSSTQPLQGLTVLVTRPKSLAVNLARLIEEQGGHAIIYPVISITDPDNKQHLLRILDKLDDFDIAIFISPTAVEKTFDNIQQLPRGVEVAAIGSSTQAALEERGVSVTIQPLGHDSESLLEHAKLQSTAIKNRSIIIFRGQGGRALMGNTLQQRGADVTYADMYKRVLPQDLPALTHDQLENIDIITITSNEGLQNLYDLNPDSNLLTTRPILVPGSRSHVLAETLGFSTIVQSDNATDTACLKTLVYWAQSR